jgi:glucose/arabinose dehydrogenase
VPLHKFLIAIAGVCLAPGLGLAQSPTTATGCPATSAPIGPDGKPGPVAGSNAFMPKPCMVEGFPIETRKPELDTDAPAFPGQTRAPFRQSRTRYKVTVVTDQLKLPWSLQVLPDGKMLVTEKPGAMRIVGQNGTISPPLTGLPPISYKGDAGLLDVALDPRFARNHAIYFNYIRPEPNDQTRLVLAKAILDEATGALTDVKVIFLASEARPTNPSNNQNGRIAFARDGTLFMSLGDRSRYPYQDTAQRLDTTLGKIVHLTADGAPAKDNPFLHEPGAQPEIWAMGFRTPEGLAFDAKGRLWENENGPRGGDELNLIRKGGNYGWPKAIHGIDYSGAKINGGSPELSGSIEPRYYWDPVIAPSGLAFYHGKMFPEWEGSVLVGALRGKMLDRLVLADDRVVAEEPLLVDMNARIRDVRIAPDGAIYVLEDGKRLFKITPE